MFESDADRLASLRAVGAELFEAADGTFWALLEQPFAAVELESDRIESRKPVLTMRESDATRLELTNGAEVTRIADGVVYRVLRPEPDGSGMTQLFVNPL